MSDIVLSNQNRVYKDDLALGIDYGSSNVGIAIGREGNVIPLTVIPAKDPAQVSKEISRIVHENKIKTVVLGLPLTLDNKETKKSLEVRRFAKTLRILLKMPVEFVNEHSTSIDSIQRSIELGMPQSSRKKIDHLSAALILKAYFDSIDS